MNSSNNDIASQQIDSHWVRSEEGSNKRAKHETPSKIVAITQDRPKEYETASSTGLQELDTGHQEMDEQLNSGIDNADSVRQIDEEEMAARMMYDSLQTILYSWEEIRVAMEKYKAAEWIVKNDEYARRVAKRSGLLPDDGLNFGYWNVCNGEVPLYGMKPGEGMLSHKVKNGLLGMLETLGIDRDDKRLIELCRWLVIEPKHEIYHMLFDKQDKESFHKVTDADSKLQRYSLTFGPVHLANLKMLIEHEIATPVLAKDNGNRTMEGATKAKANADELKILIQHHEKMLLSIRHHKQQEMNRRSFKALPARSLVTSPCNM